jgi:hypothetical protein
VRAQVILATLLLASCASDVRLSGRYARALSPTDIEQIRGLTQEHIVSGHTSVTIDAVRPDRVRVVQRTYRGVDWTGTTQQVVRRAGRWQIDKNFSGAAEAGTSFSVQ